MSATQSDVQFFVNNACFSYDPKTQTEEEGRLQCAERAAEAEDILMQAMRVGDVSVSWQDDARTGDEFEEVERVESCAIEINGEIVASLFAVWDADANYRRVIRAELAIECLDQLRAVVAVA